MRKIGILVFLIVILVFFKASLVSAQNPPVQDAQSWKCMRGEEQGFTFNGAGNTTFTQELYADGYPADIDAYIVSCVGSQTGSICTTGDKNYDALIFNNDNTTLFPYTLVIEGGSKQKIALGKLRVKATVTTQGLTGGMVFYSVTFADVEDTVGAGPGQKLGVFPFADSFTTKCATISWNTVFPPPRPPEDECRGDRCDDEKRHRRWDPFGIVFDSQSLEPLPNTKVTILNESKNIYNLVGLTNPQITKADGLFNFLVEPGTYYLLAEPQAAGHQFTATPNLHPNYIKIYHKIDGSNSIYKPDEPVIEIIDTPEEIANGKPNMEHRDIPLDPGTNLPYNGIPSTISYNMKRIGNSIEIDGKISHPFTEVSFYQGAELLDFLKTVRADRFGYYETILGSDILDQNKDVYVVYTKADLRTYNPDVLSAQTEIKISSSAIEKFSLAPIPAYIEGYSYDKNDRLLADSTVRLKLKMNNAVFYETKTDKNGYFIIPPKFTPIFPYYLEITPEEGVPIVYSTSEFASKNKEYLDDGKINLLAGTKEGKIVSKNADEISPPSSPPKKNKIPLVNVAKRSSLLLFFILFLFFFVSVLVTFLIIKRKKQNTT